MLFVTKLLLLSNRSLCYYNIGKYKEAYEDAGCCCGIRPNWAKGFARRGFAAEELKEWKIALESYDEYLKLDKSDDGEMDIKTKQRNVKKIVDEIEKKKQDQERELQRIDGQLSAMKDNTEQKQIKLYSLLHIAMREMNIEKVELAVKHGVDLSRKYKSNMRSFATAGAFSNADFAEAERIYATDPNWHHSIGTGAAEAMIQLVATRSKVDDSQFQQTALLSKQRDYLDRLLDLVEKQRAEYQPPVKLMKDFVVELLLAGGNKFPFRTDFFLLLNTERGKKFFVGDTMNMKQWRLQLAQSILAGGNALGSNYDPSKMEPKGFGATSRPSGIHLRRMLECLEMCLQGVGAKDLNTKIVVVEFGRGREATENESQTYLLDFAVRRVPSPEIIELLLSRGADPNVESTKKTNSRTSSFSVLDVALQDCHSCVPVLLAHGAKIITKSLPKDWDWILIHPLYSLAPSTSSPASVTLRPQTNYYPHLWDFLSSITDDAADDTIEEDVIRALFDAMTEQNISFIGFTNAGTPTEKSFLYTPLTFSFYEHLPLKRIEAMLKVRPKLLHTPIPPPYFWFHVPVTSLCYPAMFLCFSVAGDCSKSKDSEPSSLGDHKSVMKLFIDQCGCDVGELPWFRTMEFQTITFPDGLKKMIRQVEDGELGTMEDIKKRVVIQGLKRFEGFCLNYGIEKKNKKQKKEVK